MKKMVVNWEPSGPAQALTSLTKSSSLSLQLEKSQANVMWAAENISKSDNYDPADEVEWAYTIRELGYNSELFLLFEEGRGGLYGSPTN